MSHTPDWIDGMDAAVTVTDADGIIIALNRGAREAFADSGGASLLGSNVFDCHPEPSRTQTVELFASRTPNHYTLGERGSRKVVHQMPWFADGSFGDFIEISIPIPATLPHVDRG